MQVSFKYVTVEILLKLKTLIECSHLQIIYKKYVHEYKEKHELIKISNTA